MKNHLIYSFFVVCCTYFVKQAAGDVFGSKNDDDGSSVGMWSILKH